MRLLLSVRDPQDCPDDKLRDVLADLMDALGYEYVETDETNWAQKNDMTERIVLPSACKEATCTCPSGDGSLRWPCPAHPPSAAPAVLPDGSAFAVYSYPLPKGHWLYAPREYEQGAEEPKELAAPILTHAAREQVVSAIRYAIRAATDCGKETDFDPDALVQNAVYALCGPFNKNQPQPQADATTPQGLRECCEHLNAAGHAFWAACAREADGGAVRWVQYADGSLIVFTRGEYKDQLMSALGGLYSAPTKVFEHHSDEFDRETQAFEATDKPQADARDAAFEAVRKKLCKLQRYSFWLDEHGGGVQRVKDRCGNWIGFDAAHELFDTVAIDSYCTRERAQAQKGQS